VGPEGGRRGIESGYGGACGCVRVLGAGALDGVGCGIVVCMLVLEVVVGEGCGAR
jgi:hypothetical protein